MTTTQGPKLMFIKLEQKIYPKEEVCFALSSSIDLDLQQQEPSIFDRKVSFADSTLIFLRYSEEDVYHFRSRLKAQIQSCVDILEPNCLNPTLCSPQKQQRKKSCFREPEYQAL